MCDITEEYERKKEGLKKRIRFLVQEDCMVAFSGGVDSSLLLKLVCEAVREGPTPETVSPFGRIHAVTMQTRLHPLQEIEQAARVAEEIGVGHLLIPVDELSEAGISQNPPDRCYRCKRHLFSLMLEAAEKLGIRRVLEGTNADDLHMYRPGLKAIRELGIISPLADAGFCKQDVRRLAEEYGLSVSDKPAMPCLATRFPYGVPLSYEELDRVEQGEAFLRTLGLYNVRLRIHGQIARIEVDGGDMEILLEHREEIVSRIKETGYDYVTLDLEGFRSGSMDIRLDPVYTCSVYGNVTNTDITNPRESEQAQIAGANHANSDRTKILTKFHESDTISEVECRDAFSGNICNERKGAQ